MERKCPLLSFSVLCASAKDAEDFCELHFLCSTPQNVNHDKMSVRKTLLLSCNLGCIYTSGLPEYQEL